MSTTDTSPTLETQTRLVGSDRVLSILSLLAAQPAGATLDELVRMSGHPKATVHRGLAALHRAGFARKLDRGRYILGDEFLRLAFTHHAARPEHVRVLPLLQQLSTRFGETAHFAVLEDDHVIYRAKVDPPAGAARLTSTVGGRNPAHSTAVGKMLLSYQLRDIHDVHEWIGGRTLEQKTDKTAVTATELDKRLSEARMLGYCIDDQETDPGVNCIAFPVFLASPTEPSGAVSVSALAYRTPLAQLVAAADQIRSIIAATTGTPATANEHPRPSPTQRIGTA